MTNAIQAWYSHKLYSAVTGESKNKEEDGMKKLLIGATATALIVGGAAAGEIAMNGEELLRIAGEIHSKTRGDLIGLIGAFTAVWGIITALVGLAIFRQIKAGVNRHLRNKILENEAKTLINLGKSYYSTSCETRQAAPEIAYTSICHAINHSLQAVYQLGRIDDQDGIPEEEKINMKGLALSNIAYYLADRADLAEDPKNTLNTSEGETIRELAVKKANEAAIFVESIERRRVVQSTHGEIQGMTWWDVVESRLNALVRCDREFDIRVARRKLQKLFDDASVPSAWKREIKKDWEEWIKKEEWE